MKRFIVGLALLAWVAVMAGAGLRADDKVTFHDRGKKTIVVKDGKIKSESLAKGINFQPSEPKAKAQDIPAGDVEDVIYDLPGLTYAEARKKYRNAQDAEKQAEAAATPAARREKLQEAVKVYQTMLPDIRPLPNAARHIEFKIARLTARMGADDKIMAKEAISLLLAFKKAHATAWQVVPCLERLAELQAERDDFKGASATYDEMAKMNELPAETRKRCAFASAEILVRGGKDYASAAAEKLKALRAGAAPGDPDAFRLDMLMAMSKASDPRLLDGAVQDLKKQILGERDKVKLAIMYNTLGECYLRGSKPQDAMHQFLIVDLVYNEDAQEQARACAALARMPDQLRSAARAKEYAAKAATLKP